MYSVVMISTKAVWGQVRSNYCDTIHRIITLSIVPTCQFCWQIIYCNNYVQCAYDSCLNYCDTQNYYSIYLVSSVVK